MHTIGLWDFHKKWRGFIAWKKIMGCHDTKWWNEQGCNFDEFYSYLKSRSIPFDMRITKSSLIIRCARRYIRRYGGARTVGAWNKLCARIAKDTGLTHHSTLRSAMIEGRNGSRVIYGDDCDKPRLQFLRYLVYERYKRIQSFKKERIERIAVEIMKAEYNIKLIRKSIRSAKAAMRGRT